MKDIIRRVLLEHRLSLIEQRTKWTLEMVMDLAKNFDKLVDFRKAHPNALQWAQKNGHLSTVTSHMEKRKEWTKDEVMSLAKNFTKIKDFQNAFPNAYSAALNNGWKEDVTSHMVKQKESWTLEKVLELAQMAKNMEDFRTKFPRAYDASRNHQGWKEEVWKLYKPQQVEWTYDLAKSIADRYDDLTEFQKNESKAIAAIRRLGWLDLLSHMKKDKRTWTDNEIRQEALKYDNVKDFREKSSDAYYAAFSHKIYDEVTAHMKRQYTLDWTKDMVWKEALKYNTRSEFMDGNYAAYQQAHSKGWIEDVTSHMTRLGNLYKRIVYVYEFPDNSAYIGLTLNKEDRDRRHKQKIKSAVFKHIQATGLQPTLKYVSDDYIDAEDARKLEHCTIEEYRAKGWNILNKASAGGLGGCSRIWRKDEVIKLAQKYDSPSDFKSKHSSAFNAAEKNGWLKDVTKHMTKTKTKWTKDLLFSLMDKYNLPKELRKNDPKTFTAAFRILGNQGIIDFYTQKNDLSNKR